MAAAHEVILAALGAPKGKGMPGKGSPDPDAKDEAKEDDIESAAAQDLLDAVKSNDAAGARDALHRFVMSCMSDYGEDEPSEES